MKKHVVAASITAGLLAAGLMLSGCSGINVKKQSESEDKVTITIGGWADKDKSPDSYAASEARRQAFMDQNPDINVETDTWSYTVDTFLPKAAANQLPTYFYLPFTETDKVIDARYVADITEYMDKYGYIKNMRQDVLDQVTRDGKIYMVPLQVYALGLVANLDVMRQANLLNEDGTFTYPETFEELGRLAGEIKSKTGKAGFVLPTMNNAGGWHFMNIAWSYGVNFMEKTEGKWKAAFNSPEGEAALQFVHDLKWKYDALSDNIFIDNAEGKKMLGSGQGAMFFSAIDENLLRTLCMRSGMNKDDLSMGKIPAGPAGQYALMGGSLYAIRKDATPKQIDAVFQWMEYNGDTHKLTDEGKKTMEEKLQINLKEGIPVLPTTPFSVWETGDTISYSQELHQQYGNMDIKKFEDYLDFNSVTLKSEEPVNCQELYSILDSCIQEVLTNEDIDIKALLDKAANDFQVNYLNKTK